MKKITKIVLTLSASVLIITAALFSANASTSYSGDAIVIPGSPETMEIYSVTLDVTKREITSADISIKWTQTIKPGYYDKYRYDMEFTCSGESVTKTVVPANTWSEISEEERSKTTEFILTVPVSTVDSATAEISGTIYQYTSTGVLSGSDSETPGKMSLEIPAYTKPIKTYTVAYDANGGTEAPENQTKTESISLALSSNKPLRSGYTFLGWSDSPSATAVQYLPGDTYNENSDKTLYAVWSENYFKITTDAKGGHFKDGSSSKNLNYREFDKVFPENFDIPEKDGYAFAGWLGTKSVANPAAENSNSFTVIFSKTYYAVWRIEDTGTVYISGSDIISGTEECGFFSSKEQKEQVITLILEGVNYIGTSAFADYPNLENVILLSENSDISDKAFLNCPKLETVIIFGNTSFTQAAFSNCSRNIRIFVNALCKHPGISGTILYEFKDGTLEFDGNLKLDRYEFFDTISAFCLKYNNISKLKFSKFSFEDISLYYYADENSEPVLIESNTLDEGEITVCITENGENKQITFNKLIEGIEDGSINDFILSATDKTHGKTKDTVFSVIYNGLMKALKWVISLMNKVFKLVGKK